MMLCRSKLIFQAMCYSNKYNYLICPNLYDICKTAIGDPEE